MNFEQARENMIKQQMRTCEVSDDNIIETLSTISREHFVPEKFENLAFADTQIPIGHEQIMMSPFEEGRMIQALQIKPTDSILEIGTGTGYITALLAKLGKLVISVDIFSDFTEYALQKLKDINIENVSLVTADAALGWETTAPYDVIAVTGAYTKLPQSILKQIKIGGRLFAVVGKAPAMTAAVYTRIEDNKWEKENLFETVLPNIINEPQESKFKF